MINGLKSACSGVLLVITAPAFAAFASSGVEPSSRLVIASTVREGVEPLAYYHARSGSPEAGDLLVLLNGSGCNVMKPFFERMVKRVGAAAPDNSFDIVLLEKNGVSTSVVPAHYGSGERCTAEFHESNQLVVRVKAQRALIQQLMNERAYERVVVAGFSDGAIVAAALAAEEPTVTHLVMVGSGGMKLADELLITQSRGAFPGFEAKDLEEGYREVRKYPADTSKFFLGQTYRYMSDMLWVDPLGYLLKLDIPILIGIGSDDKAVPVESAYYLGEAFAKARKSNLSLHVYGGADHGLRVGDRSYMVEFLGEMVRWMEGPQGDPAIVPSVAK